MKVLILLCTLVPYCAAYSLGAPPSACGDMIPQHGVAAQSTASPFELVISGGTCYKDTSTLRVIVNTTNPEYYFEGLFIQARIDGSNTVAYGKFDNENDEDTQVINCLSGTENAATHAAHDKWTWKSFVWTMDAATQQDLVFQATVVKGKTTFWTEIKSSAITYDAGCTATAGAKPTESDMFGAGDGGASSEEEGGNSTETGDDGDNNGGTSAGAIFVPLVLVYIASLLATLKFEF